MSKLLAQIPKMRDQELEDLYANIIEFILKNEESGNSGNVEAGKANLASVLQEIQKRGELAAKGEYTPDKREEGMLSLMGYHVGKSGVVTKIRRRILDRAVNGPLPPLANMAYSEKWGEPGTEERLSMIARSIAFFIFDNKKFNDENRAKALIEWDEDMEWLKKTYYEPKKYGFNWPKSQLK